MTTVDTAAAWHAKKPVALMLFVMLAATGLAGCETGSNLLAGGGPSPSIADPAAALASPQSQKKLATIAVAPIIGAPETVAKQLQAQLTSAAEKQGFAFVKSPIDKLDYTLRGYVVSARDKGGVKVSYIWDVTDPAGRRVNRITGEEMISGAESKDPWTLVSAAVTQSIADKSAASLAAWVPSQQGAAVAGNAAAQPTAATLGGPASGAAPTPPAAAQPVAAQSVASSTTTGSIADTSSLTASVPSVVGAPGDGSTALASALQRELSKGGVALADGAAAAGKPAYRVEGRVKLGEAREGKQPISIDWDVKDPKGKKLGTVSQNNEIPQGSLDGQWGRTADAAAAAAAQGILKLLPQNRQTN